MLRLVNSEYLKQVFDEIWKQVYSLCNYELEEFNGEDVVRFVVKHHTKETHVGTIEILLDYKKNGKDYEDLFKFSKTKEIKRKQKKTCIIQKVAILPEYQGGGYLEYLLNGMVYAIEKHDLDYAIAFIEPKLYLALKMMYGVEIFKPINPDTGKSAKRFEYKGDDVIPVVIDLKATLTKKEKLTWIRQYEDVAEVLLNSEN